MGNMVTRTQGETIVVVHNTETPTSDDWEDVLTFFRNARDIGALRVLVFTDGAAPNTMQRASFNKILDGKQPRIAVLSASRVVRGVATAISWFNPNIDVFPPDNVDRALDHLRVDASERRTLVEIARELRGELSRSRTID